VIATACDGEPCFTSVTVDVVSEEAFIDSEKLAVIAAVPATPVAPLGGVVDSTVGAAVSGAAR
jgi:hypothetical protein